MSRLRYDKEKEMKIRLMFVSNSSSSSSIIYIPKDFKAFYELDEIPEDVKETFMEHADFDYEEDDDPKFGSAHVDMINDMLSSLFQGNEINEGDADNATYAAVQQLIEPYELTSVDSGGGGGEGSIIPITEKDVEKVMKQHNKKK